MVYAAVYYLKAINSLVYSNDYTLTKYYSFFLCTHQWYTIIIIVSAGLFVSMNRKVK